MSSRDPERGCGCLALIVVASVVVLVVLVLIDVRLAALWLIAGAVAAVLLDSWAGD